MWVGLLGDYGEKCSLKRWVFKFFLKVGREGEFLRDEGNEFQKWGA
jgi:hypothetical protein